MAKPIEREDNRNWANRLIAQTLLLFIVSDLLWSNEGFKSKGQKMDDETMSSPTAKKIIANEMDVVQVRQLVKKQAVKLKFGLTEQTKLVTAASEIARNTLKYGLGGDLKIYHIKTDFKEGLKLVFQDQGSGIADIEQALQNGFTSGKGIGLGLGLGGSQRLVSEFNIISKIGHGTTVTLIKWRT